MTNFQALILGLIEGITEFLPISSTGHMVLASHAMGIGDDEFTKSFEVIIQMGAILTVLVLYWRRFFAGISFYRKIMVAFVPTAILGFLLKSKVDQWLEDPRIVAFALILGGIVLIWIDRRAEGSARLDDLDDKTCVKLGLFQSLALIPGVSRSGATIVGGLLSGLRRADAAEFSFFLAVPTMAAATGYKLLKMWKAGATVPAEQWGVLAIGFGVSFVVAGLAIKGFISLISRRGFALFGWYRIILGAIVLIVLATGADLRT